VPDWVKLIFQIGMVVTGEEGDDTRVFNQGIISEWFNQRYGVLY